MSGGPIIVTFHSNRSASSTSPAENPSTGFLVKSEIHTAHREHKSYVNYATKSNTMYRRRQKGARIAAIPLSLDRLHILNANTEGDTYPFPYIYYAVTN